MSNIVVVSGGWPHVPLSGDVGRADERDPSVKDTVTEECCKSFSSAHGGRKVYDSGLL